MNIVCFNSGILLLLNGVMKCYGDNIIFNELDLYIFSGQFVVVVGCSGGGKSILLCLLVGLEKLNVGELLVGVMFLVVIQDDIWMMFQDVCLLLWKIVIDNVGLGLKGVWCDVVLQVLVSVGFESCVQEWLVVLLGGQKQCVVLVCVLIYCLCLLLLDELLGVLDVFICLEMQELIVFLWQEYGFMVLLVMYDVSEVVVMVDWVLLIEEKKIGFDLSVDIL